jgi:23S rRNA (uracil1939-C5)-methyltransferase
MELELRIASLAAGGDGVARAPDGRVVFVPLTAPGDLVVARVERERRRFAFARVERVLEEGPGRTKPICPVFGRCGGCAWQHLAYEVQLAAKARIVEDALARIGGTEPPRPVAVVPSPSPWRYRSRARLLVRRGRLGYRERRSHALCAIERCPLLAPELERALDRLVRKPPPGDGEWELAAGIGGTRVSRVGSRKGAPVDVEVAGDRVGISPGVFSQPNALLASELARRVHAAAGEGAHALELFAGAGTFTLGLARRFRGVTAVEGSAAAVRDLERNLRRAGLPGVRVVRAPVERALAELSEARPDAVVLDPPRTGLPTGCAERIAALAPQRVVYLSCDPATLARDLVAFRSLGFALLDVEAFDLFPQTPHVEVLARLTPAP